MYLSDGAHFLFKLQVHWLGRHCRKSSLAASKTKAMSGGWLWVLCAVPIWLHAAMLDCPIQDKPSSAIEETLSGLWLLTMQDLFAVSTEAIPQHMEQRDKLSEAQAQLLFLLVVGQC